MAGTLSPPGNLSLTKPSMTIRAVAIHNKGQSYEVAQISADNDSFISDLTVLPPFFLSCVHASNENTNSHVPSNLDHRFKTGSMAFHI